MYICVCIHIYIYIYIKFFSWRPAVRTAGRGPPEGPSGGLPRGQSLYRDSPY